MRVSLTIIAVVVGLAACGQPKPARDKAFFAAHEPERAQTLAACRNDPARDSSDPDCVNAVEADSDVEHQRAFHGVPSRPAGVANARHL